MSGADDQRAAERLRDVVVCHCYEIAGPVGGGHWASCLAEEIGDEVIAVLEEADRLRAELAETRAAGDSLAAIASVMTEDSTTERWDSLGEATHTYWSVRGDARTAPAADVRDPDSETHRTSAAPDGLPRYAIIQVSTETNGMQGSAWPIVERVPGGWQSGAHHYPDAEVGQVRPLALAAPADDTAAPDGGNPSAHAAFVLRHLAGELRDGPPAWMDSRADTSWRAEVAGWLDYHADQQATAARHTDGGDQ